ncbi:MAG: Ig-like domain-containing protein [Spirochaetia bacterium]|nr:Ig-like domain-containing protein [Spirochaetia bacterium]
MLRKSKKEQKRAKFISLLICLTLITFFAGISCSKEEAPKLENKTVVDNNNQDDTTNDDNQDPIVDTTIFEAVFSPANNSIISDTMPIVVTFSKAVDDTSLVLTGTMASSALISWDTSGSVLTLTPAAAWPIGGGQTLVIDCSDLQGVALTVNITYTVDTVGSLTAVPSIVTGSTITGNEIIQISFSRSMNASTLSLSGAFASETAAPIWSANDTVVSLTPISSWSEGILKDLIIDCNDLSGVSLTTLTLNYTVDGTAPSGSSSVVDGSTVSTSQAIVITFTEPMDTTSLVLSGILSSEAAAAVWSAGNTVLTIIPIVAWSEGAAQTLVIDISDLAGNALPQLSLSFIINANVPTAVLSPADGSTIGPVTSIVITFSQTMNPATLSLSGSMSTEAGAPQWSVSDTVLTIMPSTAWAGGSQDIIVNCSDPSGNVLPTLNLNYFVDAAAPTAVNITPASGSIIGPNASIEITFSETMTQGSLNLTDLDMSTEAGAPQWSVSDTVLTITPTTTWSAGARTLTVQATDLYGNLISIPFNFTVDATAPSAMVSPVNTATIGADWPIVITFTKTMDTSTLSLAGTLSSEGSFAWSGSDTILTISPATTWPNGAGGLIVNASDTVGNALPTVNLTYSVDAVLPSAVSVSPASASTIGTNTPISITFSESMDVGSLALTGDMAAEVAAVQWSVSNTVLTISPSTTWSAGVSRTLTVDGTDLYGNFVSLPLNFTVDVALLAGAASPTGGSTISQSENIVITFTQQMNTAALSLTGTLSAEASTAWSGGDTILTISPVTTWTGGSQTLIVDGTDLSSNVLPTMSLTYSVDATAPTALNISSVDGSTIGPNMSISITFSEPMTPGSEILLGTLSADADNVQWSAGNTVLTMSSSAGWTAGAGTLTVEAEDLYGNLISIPLSYTIDATSPTAMVLPSNGATIGVDTNIEITFSRAMDTSTLSMSGILFSEGSIAWSGGDTILTLSPATSWTGGTGKTLVVNCNDTLGSSITTLNLAYTVDSTSPTAGISVLNNSTIGAETSIVFTFTESMNTAGFSVTGDLALEMGALQWSAGDTVLTIIPATTWSSGASKTLIINGTDLYNNPISTLNLTYNVDAVYPTAIESPLSSSTISAVTSIVITFSKPMDTASLAVGGTLSVEAAVPVWSAGDTVLTIYPSALWGEGAGRTLIVDAADLYGNSVATLNLNYTVDATAPTGSVSPLSGAVISTETSIIINFSEAMNTSTVSVTGDLSGEMAALQWSAGNSVLTVNPLVIWTEGLSRSLIINGEDLQGNALSTMTLYYDIAGYVPPVVFPVSGSTIGTHSELVIQFNSSVNITSVIIGGTLYSLSDGGLWSSTVYTNDTLTIRPSTAWSTGTGQTITVDAYNMAGEIENVSNSYNIIDIAIYVRADGDDAYPGSKTQPKKTIQAAIESAVQYDMPIVEIHVAEGVYQTHYQAGDYLMLSDGIYLYGGYSASDWSLRDSVLYETIIQDTSIAGGLNTPVEIQSVQYSLINGFTIKAGNGYNSTAILISGNALVSDNKFVLGNAFNTNYGIFAANSSIIKDNQIINQQLNETVYGIYEISGKSMITGNSIDLGINGNSNSYGIYTISSSYIANNQINSGSNDYTYGLYCNNASPTVLGNIIDAGTAAFSSYGIYNNSSKPAVINNVINGGSAATNSYGIYNLTSFSYFVQNNTIIGGPAQNSYGIFKLEKLKIDNNILLTQGTSVDVCLYEANSTDDPTTVRNNDLFSCTVYRDFDAACTGNADGDSQNSTCALTEAEALTDALISGNVSVDPLFVNQAGGNFNLQAASPVSVTAGGLDGAAINWLFNIDILSVTRTGDGSTGWSMGAYEY